MAAAYAAWEADITAENDGNRSGGAGGGAQAGAGPRTPGGPADADVRGLGKPAEEAWVIKFDAASTVGQLVAENTAAIVRKHLGDNKETHIMRVRGDW